MKEGDQVEVEISEIGILSNIIKDEKNLKLKLSLKNKLIYLGEKMIKKN